MSRPILIAGGGIGGLTLAALLRRRGRDCIVLERAPRFAPLGAGITLLTALTTLWVGYAILKLPFPLLTGLLAGLQTQPAVLGFASERAGNDLPNVAYASVYPVATVAKIVLAQLLLNWLH